MLQLKMFVVSNGLLLFLSFFQIFNYDYIITHLLYQCPSFKHSTVGDVTN